MAKYKFISGDDEDIIEAKNKAKARKKYLTEKGIVIEKIENDESEVNPTPEDVDIIMYWQLNSRYDGWKLGNSSTSMQQYGCALMCFSLVFGKDPKDVDQLFIDNGVYSGDCIIFEKACEVLGGSNYVKDTDINNMPEQEVTIKEVWLGSSQHFVVRFNVNGDRYIFDPWTGNYQTINYYPFKSYRQFDGATFSV